MPYATRKMVQYMKESGMSNVEEGSTGNPEGDKKIRELPSSVDPVDEDSADKKSASSASKPKSAAGGSKSKAGVPKSTSAASKSGAGKAKSSTTGAGSKVKSSKAKSKKGQGSKKSSSGASVKSSKSSASEKGRTRVVAATSMALKPVMVSGMNYDGMSFDQKRVQFIQTLLKSNVSKLKEMSASDPYEEAKKEFNMYSIEKKKPLDRKPHSAKALYECTHKSFPDDCLVVCKVYDAKSTDPTTSLFLKVLRHLGKKHPNITQTWDVILKEGSVYVFQELAPYGNMLDYMAKKGALKEEEQAQEVAKQIRTGMDFLGDMAVSHRSICPRHILVLHKDLRVKITGFLSAIIYYDDKKDDINYQPCLPLDKKGKAEDYQAPEVYGNARTELFDPVTADTWSFGATLYHLLTAKYPYDSSKNNAKIENEIQGNVRGLKLSDNGKSALGFMLLTDSPKRISIDKLKEHPWFKEK